MRRTRLAALLALLFVSGASAAPKPPEAALPRDRARSAAPRRAARAPEPEPAAAQPPEDKRIHVSMKRIKGLVAEIKPLMARLADFKDSYADGDLAALGREREPLLRELEAKRETLRDETDDFKTLRKEFQFRQGAAIISAIAGGGSADVQDSLRRVMDYDNYPKEVARFRDQLDEALRADLSAFDQARAARESAVHRKRLAWSLTGAGVVFIVFVGWLLRRAKGRRRETVTAMPVRVVPEPVLAGGPPTPALGRTAPVRALGGPATAPIARRAEPALGAILGGTWRVMSPPSMTALGSHFDGEEVQVRRPVVIRRVREELHRNEKDLDRLLERARQVAALKHLNLCEVYAVFVEEDRVHIVSERVDGKPVSEFIEPGRRINLTSVKRVLGQAARAVDYAHQSKILHGDLTPQCLMVTRDGLTKVADFGIGIEARKIAAKLSWSDPIGNPAYLAPEQELGAVFKESDVFSLGVILYEMAMGVQPFEGPNYLAQKRERSFKAPSAAAGLSKDLDNLVAKALSPEPQHRFRSAADFAAALEKLPDP
ncbi:MAG: protein kinase [Elusimicrobia bacterium]|nr:protein kinase [Elusimicrobiota bacterium]